MQPFHLAHNVFKMYILVWVGNFDVISQCYNFKLQSQYFMTGKTIFPLSSCLIRFLTHLVFSPESLFLSCNLYTDCFLK